MGSYIDSGYSSESSSSNPVDISFNGFTFESSSDTLYLKCTIEMCALNLDGTFVDSSCGFAYGGDDCADTSSTMGMTKLTKISFSLLLDENVIYTDLYLK